MQSTFDVYGKNTVHIRSNVKMLNGEFLLCDVFFPSGVSRGIAVTPDRLSHNVVRGLIHSAVYGLIGWKQAE